MACVARMLSGSWDQRTGRERALSLRYAVEATAIYQRRNHVQDTLGEIYNTSQFTISRMITVLTPLVRDATDATAMTLEEVCT